MKVESTEWGCCLPGKTYFPVYLSNGVDGMMINLLGSSDCWFELMHTDYGAPLSSQKAPGWYKCDRRTVKNTDLVYGTLFPLFEFASSPFLNGDLSVPRNCRQYFNPRTATITTFYEQLDNETLEWMRVKVTTFLTKAHILVEHYEFLEAPVSGASIVFFLNSPSEAYLNIYEKVVGLDNSTVQVEEAESMMIYDYSLEGYVGGARSWFDCEAQAGMTGVRKNSTFSFGRLQTRAMFKGESFTRYLTAIDNQDTRDYRQALDAAVKKCRTDGYPAIQARHKKDWEDFFSTSSVNIPDEAISYLYETSRYLIRSNFHSSGYIPMGNVPYLWQGVMFWDACFAIKALIGNGNLTEARLALDRICEYLTEGRRKAAEHGVRGFRMEWTVEMGTFTKYPELTTQVHNNAWWAHTIYSFYDAAQDEEFLERNFEIMGELLLFLIEGFIDHTGDRAFVKRCSGPDESISSEKDNDTWTNAVTLRALMDYREATRILNRDSIIKDIDSIIRKLTAGLDDNVDDSGVMQSFHGGKLPHWGSLIFDLFPHHSSLEKTLERMMVNYDPAMELYNFHGVTRYADKAFPWGDYWAARCFAQIGDPRALHLLTSGMKSANCFGGMPERVFYHGELFNNWFLTAHAAFIWAVNGMLANAKNDTLRILGGCHQGWVNVSFENLHAGQGLIVSGRIKHQRLTILKVHNLGPVSMEMDCVLGSQARGRHLIIKPGINTYRFSNWNCCP